MNKLDGFGKRLKDSIKKSGYTQKYISERIDVSQDSLSNYVKGNSFPNTQTLVYLCELLSVSSDFLLFGKKSDFSKTDTYLVIDIKALNKKIDILSDKRKSDLTEYVDFLVYKDNQENIIKENSSSCTEKKLTLIPPFEDIQDEEEEYIEIPLEGEVAAGLPIYLPDEYSMTDIVSVPTDKRSKNADFALRVKGDSMEPLIQNGEIILVKAQPDAENGQIVVVAIDNTVTLKKFYRYDNKVELKSINPKYSPIVISSKDIDIEFRIIGIKL